MKTNKWEEKGSRKYVKQFGPITATILFTLNLKDESASHYYGFLSVGEAEFGVTVAELGIDWFDDKADKLGCRELEKQIKKHIRSWAK